MPCVLQPTLHSGNSHKLDLCNIKIHAHLKFSVSGRSKQASKHTSIHTHVCNEVTLVWGSLRLAPIKLSNLVTEQDASVVFTANKKGKDIACSVHKLVSFPGDTATTPVNSVCCVRRDLFTQPSVFQCVCYADCAPDI